MLNFRIKTLRKEMKYQVLWSAKVKTCPIERKSKVMATDLNTVQPAYALTLLYFLCL